MYVCSYYICQPYVNNNMFNIDEVILDKDEY